MKRFLAARITRDKVVYFEFSNIIHLGPIFPYKIVTICRLSEMVKDKIPGDFYVDLDKMEKFIHRNGIVYDIVGFTNLYGDQERYCANVLYKNRTGIKKLWSRPLSDWSRSFLELSENAPI